MCLSAVQTLKAKTMKITIGAIVRFIWKNVNWQGRVVDVQQDCTCLYGTKLSVAVDGYPNMIGVPSDLCLVVTE